MKRLGKHTNRLVSEQETLESIMHNATPSSLKTSKRGRKQKKLNEKEIMAIFSNDIVDREQYRHKKSSERIEPNKYENILHLSNQEISNFENKFKHPKNSSQQNYVHLLKNKNKKIVVANGPAGTGKTLFATEYGVRYFTTNMYERLVFTRPSVAVDEDLGYLPGTLEEKMAPWIRPIYDILYRFFTPKDVSRMLEERIIEIAPLGYMRGRTFQNTWIIADEMQNSTVSQMKMLLTRLGENSRLIVTGDLDQHDKAFEVNGLEDFLGRFKNKRSGSISSFEFDIEDIQREPVVKEILEIYGADNTPDYSSESNSKITNADEQSTDEISSTEES
jgi:phosphate starvation-inducible protein PhoH and related proteins